MRRLALIGALLLAGAAAADAPRPTDLASAHFGAVTAPSVLPPRAVGEYSRGCVTGAVGLPGAGPGFQTMRPSRNRAWGHPSLVAFVRDLAAAAPPLGLNGLLVGDLSQPRGGPMPSGHASHQIGLDVDIWLTDAPATPLPDEARENLPFRSVLAPDGTRVDPALFTPPLARLIERAARDERVQRIFVHPAIKRALCEGAAAEGRAWLGKVRPWYGHHEHFHVRLRCPEGSPACAGQRPPPAGDGCGAPLDWWSTDAPYREAAEPDAPLTLARMPPLCRRLVGLRPS